MMSDEHVGCVEMNTWDSFPFSPREIPDMESGESAIVARVVIVAGGGRFRLYLQYS
jgi:hypothetical protein